MDDGALRSAVTAWVLGLFVPGYEFIAATTLWAACCLVVCLLPEPCAGPRSGASAIVFLAPPVIATVALGGTNPFATTGSAWAVSIYALVLPFMLLSNLWWWETVVELDRHRRSAAELAVTQERRHGVDVTAKFDAALDAG